MAPHDRHHHTQDDGHGQREGMDMGSNPSVDNGSDRYEHSDRGAPVVDLSKVRQRRNDGSDVSVDAGADNAVDSQPDTGADTGSDVVSGVVLSVRDDDPDGGGAGSVAVRGRAAQIEVLPSWLRSRDALAGAVAESVGYAGRWVAFHALRLPAYWARMAARAHRGAWRAIVFVFDWGTDVNGRTVRRGLAYSPSLGSLEGTAFHRVSEQHRERVRFRLAFLLMAAVVVGVAGLGAWRTAPTWWFVLAAGVLLPALGGLYRDPDRRPVLSSFAAADTHAPRVTTDLVALALSGLGLAELNKAFRPGGEPVRFLAPGVHRDGPGWRVDVDLPGGVTAGDVAERRDRLASGLRRPLSCVWPETDHDAHPGRMLLWVGDKATDKTKPKPWTLAGRGRVSLFEAFPIGVDQRGRPVMLTLMFASMVIGAVPRMGKSFTLRLILLAAALDPLAELHVFDLKGGIDHRALGMVAHRFRSGDDDEDLAYVRDDLRDLLTEMSRRYKVIRGLPETLCPEGKVTPDLAKTRTYGLHPVLVALDECQVLFEHPVYGPEAVEICAALVKRGPAVAIIAVLATQRPDAKSIPKAISANAVLRLCLKVTEQNANDMVLGTSMYKAGVRVTMFAFSDKGVGYLVGEGTDPHIVRTAYLDGLQAKTVAVRARALRQAAGTLTGHAAGIDQTPADPEDATTVLDDLAAVMPHGDPAGARVWSDVLIDRLTEHKPDVYGGWTPVDLGNAVTPYGLDTIQIGRRIDGKVTNRKGIDRAALTAALARLDTQRADRPPAQPTRSTVTDSDPAGRPRQTDEKVPARAPTVTGDTADPDRDPL